MASETKRSLNQTIKRRAYARLVSGYSMARTDTVFRLGAEPADLTGDSKGDFMFEGLLGG